MEAAGEECPHANKPTKHARDSYNDNDTHGQYTSHRAGDDDTIHNAWDHPLSRTH
jgi:hypothetical protein